MNIYDIFQLNLEENAEKKARLKSKPLGAIALKILNAIENQNLIVWCSITRYAATISFYNLSTLDYDYPLKDWELPRLEDAFVSLTNRGYITNITKGDAAKTLSEAGESQKIHFQSLRLPGVRLNQQAPIQVENVRILPWEYNAEIFVISAEGKKALAANASRLAQLKASEDEMLENPRFVISKRMNFDGEELPGIGFIYRVVKETSTKFNIAPCLPQDNAPQRTEQDYSVEKEGSVKNNTRCSVLNKNRVLAVDITVEQYNALLRSQAEYRKSVTAALDRKNTRLQPILQAFEQEKNNAAGQMELVINRVKLEISKRLTDRLADSEEGFVLSLDGEENLPEEAQISFKS